MRTRGRLWLLVAILAGGASAAAARPAQVVPPPPVPVPQEDHLKCYRIKDPMPPSTLTVLLRNQFGKEKCAIKTPADLFCAETAKNNGDDPRGRPPGDFLCYKALQCVGSVPPDTEVDDQFGARKITFQKTELLCTPANKHVCGDGDIDPGEQCDPPGSLCPDGQVCNADCTCPPPQPCRYDSTTNECTGVCPAPGLKCEVVAPGQCDCVPQCATCFDTIAMQCTNIPCSANQPCPLPNQYCWPDRCPADCPCCPACGDGVCEGDETACNCPQDCTAGQGCDACLLYVPVCGDGTCEPCAAPGESHESCPQDCPLLCRNCGQCCVCPDSTTCVAPGQCPLAIPECHLGPACGSDKRCLAAACTIQPECNPAPCLKADGSIGHCATTSAGTCGCQ